MAKGMDSSYQLLRHWQSCVSSEQAKVNACQLEKDNGGVSYKKEDSGGVLSKLSGEAFGSKGFQSERRLISTYIGVNQD